MSFSLLYSSNKVCITPRHDAIFSEKSGRGFSRFHFRGISFRLACELHRRNFNNHTSVVKQNVSERLQCRECTLDPLNWNLCVRACRITRKFLALFQPVNCIFWPKVMQNWLFAASKLHKYWRIGHVALLSGPTVHSLYCEAVLWILRTY